MDVFLSSNCFVSLVSSAAEGFPCEVIGLLFGDYYEEDEKRIIVHQAIPLQIAERAEDSVETELRISNIVSSLWDNLTTYWPVGSFHSHPYKPNEPLDTEQSSTDKRDLQREDIQIIIAVRKTPYRRKLKYNREGKRIVGTISFYQIEITCWYRNESGRIVELELWCPYIDVINLGFKIGLVPRKGVLFEPETIATYDSIRKLRTLVSQFEEHEFKFGSEEESVRIKRRIKRVLREIKKGNKES